MDGRTYRQTDTMTTNTALAEHCAVIKYTWYREVQIFTPNKQIAITQWTHKIHLKAF